MPQHGWCGEARGVSIAAHDCASDRLEGNASVAPSTDGDLEASPLWVSRRAAPLMALCERYAAFQNPPTSRTIGSCRSSFFSTPSTLPPTLETVSKAKLGLRVSASSQRKSTTAATSPLMHLPNLVKKIAAALAGRSHRLHLRLLEFSDFQGSDCLGAGGAPRSTNLLGPNARVEPIGFTRLIGSSQSRV